MTAIRRPVLNFTLVTSVCFPTGITMLWNRHCRQNTIKIVHQLIFFWKLDRDTFFLHRICHIRLLTGAPNISKYRNIAGRRRRVRCNSPLGMLKFRKKHITKNDVLKRYRNSMTEKHKKTKLGLFLFRYISDKYINRLLAIL